MQFVVCTNISVGEQKVSIEGSCFAPKWLKCPFATQLQGGWGQIASSDELLVGKWHKKTQSAFPFLCTPFLMEIASVTAISKKSVPFPQQDILQCTSVLIQKATLTLAGHICINRNNTMILSNLSHLCCSSYMYFSVLSSGHFMLKAQFS